MAFDLPAFLPPKACPTGARAPPAEHPSKVSTKVPNVMKRSLAVICVFIVWVPGALAAEPATFKVGFGLSAISRRRRLCHVGLRGPHAALSQGALDPLMAKAIVINSGDKAGDRRHRHRSRTDAAMMEKSAKR